MNETLTGNFYHKKTLFGLVLMVEVSTRTNIGANVNCVHMADVISHRRATEKDLQYLKLNTTKN